MFSWYSYSNLFCEPCNSRRSMKKIFLTTPLGPFCFFGCLFPARNELLYFFTVYNLIASTTRKYEKKLENTFFSNLPSRPLTIDIVHYTTFYKAAPHSSQSWVLQIWYQTSKTACHVYNCSNSLFSHQILISLTMFKRKVFCMNWITYVLLPTVFENLKSLRIKILAPYLLAPSDRRREKNNEGERKRKGGTKKRENFFSSSLSLFHARGAKKKVLKRWILCTKFFCSSLEGRKVGVSEPLVFLSLFFFDNMLRKRQRLAGCCIDQPFNRVWQKSWVEKGEGKKRK